MRRHFKILEANDYLFAAFGECSLGFVLISQNFKGLRSIFIGNCKLDLLKDLEKQFPNTPYIFDTKTLQDKIDVLCSFVDKPKEEIRLPLDIHGTSFQFCVWKAIQTIPAGSTASYKDIAERIHRPKASRAVARACSRNLLALAIPCHRIIESNGELGGYRWGIERKKVLLERERIFSKD